MERPSPSIASRTADRRQSGGARPSQAPAMLGRSVSVVPPRRASVAARRASGRAGV